MDLESYVTVEEVDEILGSIRPWSVSSPEVKLDAVQSAKIYTDQNYLLNFDPNDGIPANVKNGNSLLANEHITKDLFTRQDGMGAIEEKTVKAGSVTTTKKYKNTSGNAWKDPFVKISGIMRPSFLLQRRGGVRTVRLWRG